MHWYPGRGGRRSKTHVRILAGNPSREIPRAEFGIQCPWDRRSATCRCASATGAASSSASALSAVTCELGGSPQSLLGKPMAFSRNTGWRQQAEPGKQPDPETAVTKWKPEKSIQRSKNEQTAPCQDHTREPAGRDRTFPGWAVRQDRDRCGHARIPCAVHDSSRPEAASAGKNQARAFSLFLKAIL